jgi:hypothetical protein
MHLLLRDVPTRDTSLFLFVWGYMLSDKHKKILRMLKTNKTDPDDIARVVGLHPETVWGLIRGDAEEGSPETIAEFQAELQKVDTAVEQRISRKALQTKEKLVQKLKSWADNTIDITTKLRHKQLMDALWVLKKEVPEVNITSFTWKQGMSMEEALNEFKRLTAVAKQSVERARVQKVESRGTAEIPGLSGQADAYAEDPQGLVLPAKPKTRIIPQV